MIAFSEKANTLVFQVLVVPRASQSEIVGEHNGALRVRIAAAPVDGAANAELINVLARAFSVPRSAIEITRGHSGKLKTVKITNGSIQILESL